MSWIVVLLELQMTAAPLPDKDPLLMTVVRLSFKQAMSDREMILVVQGRQAHPRQTLQVR